MLIIKNSKIKKVGFAKLFGLVFVPGQKFLYNNKFEVSLGVKKNNKNNYFNWSYNRINKLQNSCLLKSKSFVKKKSKLSYFNNSLLRSNFVGVFKNFSHTKKIILSRILVLYAFKKIPALVLKKIIVYLHKELLNHTKCNLNKNIFKNILQQQKKKQAVLFRFKQKFRNLISLQFNKRVKSLNFRRNQIYSKKFVLQKNNWKMFLLQGLNYNVTKKILKVIKKRFSFTTNSKNFFLLPKNKLNYTKSLSLNFLYRMQKFVGLKVLNSFKKKLFYSKKLQKNLNNIQILKTSQNNKLFFFKKKLNIFYKTKYLNNFFRIFKRHSKILILKKISFNFLAKAYLKKFNFFLTQKLLKKKNQLTFFNGSNKGFKFNNFSFLNNAPQYLKSLFFKESFKIRRQTANFSYRLLKRAAKKFSKIRFLRNSGFYLWEKDKFFSLRYRIPIKKNLKFINLYNKFLAYRISFLSFLNFKLKLKLQDLDNCYCNEKFQTANFYLKSKFFSFNKPRILKNNFKNNIVIIKYWKKYYNYNRFSALKKLVNFLKSIKKFRWSFSSKILNCRLDTILVNTQLVKNIFIARKLINFGHLILNNKVCTSTSVLLKPFDNILFSSLSLKWVRSLRKYFYLKKNKLKKWKFWRLFFKRFWYEINWKIFSVILLSYPSSGESGVGVGLLRQPNSKSLKLLLNF